MKDSIPSPFPTEKLSNDISLFSNISQADDSGNLPHQESFSLQTDHIEQRISNSTLVGLGFRKGKEKENPVSPALNKLKRTAAIRLGKVQNSRSRKNSLEKQEQRKERTKILRRSVSLNDGESILEHASLPLGQAQVSLRIDKLRFKNQQIRKSKSYSQELNSSMTRIDKPGSCKDGGQYGSLDNQSTITCSSKFHKDQSLNFKFRYKSVNHNGDNKMEVSRSVRPFTRRSRSFNVTSANANRNIELLRTYSSHTYREKETSTLYFEGPLGIWSQKFNVNKEPSTDRISGIMKSWKIREVSDITPPRSFEHNSRHMSNIAQDLDYLSSSTSSGLPIKGIKFHKPKVNKIVIQNPAKSRTLFQPALPERLISSSSLKTDEYKGVFLLGKEIKASRVKLNVRSSLEMKLTKEKLCSVIVEDINELSLKSKTEPATYETSSTIVSEEIPKDGKAVDMKNTTYDEVGPLRKLASTDMIESPASSELGFTVSIIDNSSSSGNDALHSCEQNVDNSHSLESSIHIFRAPDDQQVVKCTPETSNNEICDDTFIKIIKEDKIIRTSEINLSISDNIYHKGDIDLIVRQSIPQEKLISNVESVGLTKGILPHLRKKKPSVLASTGSFRRNSRRVTVNLPRIDSSVSHQSYTQHSIDSVEKLASDHHVYAHGSIRHEKAKTKSKLAAKSLPDAEHATKPTPLSHKNTTDGPSESKLTLRPTQLPEKLSFPTPNLQLSIGNEIGQFGNLSIERGFLSEPRDVVYHGLALQIINSSNAKNRYLLLMDDLLVIAKPMSRSGHQSYSLNSQFLVKHIVELSAISFSASREKELGGSKAKEEANDPSSRNQKEELLPLLASTVRKFNMNPYEGIMYMIDKGALRADPLSISNFLQKTPELSRKQIGKLLGMQNNHAILNSYLDRCKLAGLRIDDALRVFLTSFRLPSDGNTIDYLIKAFSKRWHRANARNISFDVDTCIKLSFFMMALNSDIHNRKPTSKASIELVDFLGRFRATESSSTITDDILTEIYWSIRQDKLETAMDIKEHQLIPIDIKFPADHHLVINESSALITISVPMAEKDLRIKPIGDGLICDVPILDFTYTNHHTFTVKSSSLGRKCLMFIKFGSCNRKFTGVPTWSLVIEPPFMQHTFQISFPGETHKHSRKKFMFGVESSTERTLWLEKITTTFAKTSNHTNPELEMILYRLKRHLITEDPSRFLILSGYELIQYLQAPITSTALPELQFSTAMKYSSNTSTKSSFLPPSHLQHLRTSSGKLCSLPTSSQAYINRAKPFVNGTHIRNGSLADSAPESQKSLFTHNANGLSGKANYGINSS